MTNETPEVKVGGAVPNFEITCYDPPNHDFKKVTLNELKEQGKWTILFFYPADFTFV